MSKSKTGVAEWADHHQNIQTGCENACRYCYAEAMAIRFKRSTAESWKTPTDNPISKRRRKVTTGRWMFPTTHDITPRNMIRCAGALSNLLAAGNEVLIVTKPVPAAVTHVAQALSCFKGAITWRLTIGSADDAVLKYWEPGAPTFKQRLAALYYLNSHGWKVGVSCEPMLDLDIMAVVKAVLPAVTDEIWIGLPNRLAAQVAMNCPGDKEAARRAKELMAGFTDAHLAMLYLMFEAEKEIRWKDSIRERLGRMNRKEQR